MRILSIRTLREHWQRQGRGDSERPLRAWYREALHADWSGPADVKRLYRNASFLADRVVFNIAGNKYRLVVHIHYRHRVVYIRFVGTHKEYDRIDVKTI